MISIVILSITPAKLKAVCENLHQLLGDEPHEFVCITDAKSSAEGYNRGVRQARGEYIIICHDDIEILAPDFKRLLLPRLQKFDLIGVAGSTRVVAPQWVSAGPPHIFGQVAHFEAGTSTYHILIWGTPAACIPGIQVMDSIFLAGHRNVFEQIPFDEQTFKSWHLYEMDFTFRAALAGFKLAVCNDFMVIHASMGSFDVQWKRDCELFTAKFRNVMQPMSRIDWNAMSVKVWTKAEVAEILRPRFWE
jgi:hypothetical protein